MSDRNRAKFGYLLRDEIQDRIDRGELDAYDIIYTKDTYENIMISPELELIPVKSRIDIYENAAAAIKALRSSTAAYKGQLISVLDGDVYRAYVVNEDKYGNFFIVPAYENPNAIDYNLLVNIPIINKEGTQSEPVVINNLPNGYYKIVGYYNTPDQNSYLTIAGVTVSVEAQGMVKFIKRVTNKEINDYLVTPSGCAVKTYITDEYLKEKEYITQPGLTKQLAVMQEVIEAEVIQHVQEEFETEVASLVEEKINEKFSELTEEDINRLFGLL